MIGRARSTLGSSPADTLAAVDDHARKFPRGALVSEREYLRISALRKLGRTDEAKTFAKRYVTSFPSSPQTPTVKKFLEESP